MRSFLISTILLVILLIGFAYLGVQNKAQKYETDSGSSVPSTQTEPSDFPDPSQDELYSAGQKIVSLIAVVPGIRIKQSEGIVMDHRLHRKGKGRKIVITGSVSSFSDETYPDSFLRDTLTGLGWKEDFTYAADGPDGTSFAFRSGPVLCLFNASWDSHAKGDSISNVNNSYSLTIQYALTSDLEIIP